MRLRKTVVVDRPLQAVFDYLADFTTTTEWDPGTVSTVREQGDGGVGTTYRNTSEFLGRTTELRYVVQELVPAQRIRLRGENKTVASTDTMTVRKVDGGTEVTYDAEFAFKGTARFLAPLLRPALERLGRQAETGLRQALLRL
jgi:carbon monoxide dehydrogenase subunit G